MDNNPQGIAAPERRITGESYGSPGSLSGDALRGQTEGKGSLQKTLRWKSGVAEAAGACRAGRISDRRKVRQMAKAVWGCVHIFAEHLADPARCAMSENH